MSVQTASYTHNTAETGVITRHRVSHVAFTLAAFAALSMAAPSAALVAVATTAVSMALAGVAVLRIIRADRFGLASRPSIAETVGGASLVAAMIYLATSFVGAFAPGEASVATTALLVVGTAVVFAMLAALETIASALACFVIKRMAATGAIGAEIAVMLNLQQKFAVGLENDPR